MAGFAAFACATAVTLPRSTSTALVGALVAAALLTGCGGADAPGAAAVKLPANVTHPSRQSQIDGSGVVPGQAPPSDLEPLAPAAFRRPIARYRTYAARQLTAMLADLRTLRGALQARSRGKARAAWGRAYERYLRVGAAYGAFGALDTAIDGAGTTGLHRVERGLWSGMRLDGLTAPTRRLARDVVRMRRGLPTVAITPLDYAARAHEILEDAQLQQLTGNAPRWSGAGVRGVAAATAATTEVLGTLRGLMGGRTASEQAIDTALARQRTVLATLRRRHGGTWPPLSAVPAPDRRRLNAAVATTLEALAGVPGSLETEVVSPSYPAIPASAR